ncbi:VPLPA-CTERM sorting domain-containing protein [Methylophaga sp. SB9B]|uniref:choice-of-anchor K domain-containing protein n=1 Tax=Methylophaga sp. SB9B TaxID=2570356 RepID=UPI0010A81121|nr:choice-of-anchor K domain-containing protein [Methylophaga sp. SB9B]THK43091.1 VPLPA-CTERM sorting domain-containing protein [Methylophaga sp. SB9B]
MKNLLLFASLLAASLTANAATFQGSTSGTFENPTGPAGMVTTGVGTNEFTWGEGAYSHTSWQSCGWFCFQPVAQYHDPSKLKMTGTGFNTDVDQTFIAGYLNFYNGIIYSGTQAEGVDLSLTLNFTSPSAFSETFNYGFSLNNVVNPTGDTTTFLTSVPTKFYSYAGTDYYFELLGFGIHTKNGIKLIDEIFLKEGKNTTVKLLGQFTSMPSEVPLPAAVWLFGSGLMGFMAMRRRAKAQQA